MTRTETIRDKRYILFEQPPTVLIESGQYACYRIRLKHILKMLWCALLYKGHVLLLYDKYHVEIRKEYPATERPKTSIGAKYRKGLIVKMNVASSSHVKHPYFVRIDFYDENACKTGETKMITSIPNEHSCRMSVNSNWEYHEPRMQIMGDEKDFGHLLYNQKLH